MPNWWNKSGSELLLGSADPVRLDDDHAFAADAGQVDEHQRPRRTVRSLPARLRTPARRGRSSIRGRSVPRLPDGLLGAAATDAFWTQTAREQPRSASTNLYAVTSPDRPICNPERLASTTLYGLWRTHNPPVVGSSPTRPTSSLMFGQRWPWTDVDGAATSFRRHGKRPIHPRRATAKRVRVGGAHANKLSDVTTARMEAGDHESAILLAHWVSHG